MGAAGASLEDGIKDTYSLEVRDIGYRRLGDWQKKIDVNAFAIETYWQDVACKPLLNPPLQGRT